MKTSINASIVLYQTDQFELRRVIASLFNTSYLGKLFLIDNSPTSYLKICRELDSKIVYIHNPANPGFGASHNLAIRQTILEGGKYHFIVNPDIYFNQDIIGPMVQYMQNDSSIGMMMPEILNEDGTQQFLPKLLPSLLSILWRKIKRPSGLYRNFINKYELRLVPRNEIYNAPILSGCFTLLNMNAIREVGMYDDNFFMYYEDWDLSRRMNSQYKTIYFPEVSVYHGYDSGANKSMKLFRIYISSAITYFNKWGWIFDSNRRKVNKKTLEQFNKEWFY